MFNYNISGPLAQKVVYFLDFLGYFQYRWGPL